MPEQSTTHHRIDTGIAIAALLVAGAALCVSYFSYNLAWQADQREEESVALAATPESNCKLEIFVPRLGLCWIVTIYNQSKNPVSIVSYRILEDDFAHRTPDPSDHVPLEDLKGQPLEPPILIEPAKFAKILVRALVNVQYMTKLLDTAKRSPNKFGTLRDLVRAAGAQGTDLAGNQLVPAQDSMFELPSPQFVVETHRGKSFSHRMIFDRARH